MDISKIKVGDFIAVYSNVWRDNRPLGCALMVTHVGKLVIRAAAPGSVSGRRLRPEDVMRVFDNQEQGDTCMAAAHSTWREQSLLVKEAESQRNKTVLEAINAECA